ncbi:hypothetical protein [Sphingomonas sp. Leaf37]|uniref:hypothetical protein n=1 Tax=Sphingomonas sp. Leaf37 TaxID=2876552 RepID=UPI001E618549|nr:hypothetical protein [Sphingomonas sp. Leaf37]
MSGNVLSIADRQPEDVQRRAVAAVSLQRWREIEHARVVKKGGVPVQTDQGSDLPASLDAWYRSQPVKPGRISPRLTLTDDEKRAYGLPKSARLIALRGLGDEVDHWSVAVFPVMGGYVVGVKAPAGGGGVGVFWRLSHKASDYARRLSVEHGMLIRERYA